MPKTAILHAIQRLGASATPDDDARPNSFASLAQRVHAGKLGWTWPLVMCFIRLPILLVCFLAALLLARAAGHANPADFAEGLTRFDLPLVADIICLALLWRLTRREGIRFRDLFCWSRQRLLRDLVVGIGLFMAIYVVVFAIEAGIIITSVSGSAGSQAQTMQRILASGAINPLGMGWQIGVSALLVPISGAITEELVYRGYALARLTALTGRPWLAVALTTLGFSAQHLAYGLTSWQVALSGMAGVAVAGLIYGALYFLTRQRLTALIFVHWQSNVISLGLAPILLAILIK